MKNIFKITFIFLLWTNSVYSQNWEEVGNGMSFRVSSFFTDSVEQVLYIGGHFVFADTVEARGIAKWDGENFFDLAGGDDWCASTSCGPFLTIAKYQEEIYCNVLSPSIGGTSVSAIAKWNGNEWSSVGDIPIDGVVYHLEVYNEQLYVMGTFKMIDQDTTYSVTRWDGENWHPIIFADFPSNFQPTLMCSAFFQGDFYFGGNLIAIINGEETQDIVRWDGENWYPVAGGIHGNITAVNDIVVYKNELYVAGQFKQSDGNAGSGILKLHGDSWVDVGGSFDTPNVSVRDLVVFKGELYAMGLFDSVAGMAVSNIAKWNGIEWCSLGSQFDKGLMAGGVYNDELYVGGAFDLIDGNLFNHIAIWTGGDYVDTCGAVVSTIKTENKSLSIELYPTPTNDVLYISTKDNIENKSFTLTIYNILGERLFVQREFDLNEELDLSKLSSGTYILQLHTQEMVSTRKFVVHH